MKWLTAFLLLCPSFALAQCGPNGCPPQSGGFGIGVGVGWQAAPQPQVRHPKVQTGNVALVRSGGGIGSGVILKKHHGGYYVGMCDHQTRDNPNCVEIMAMNEWRETSGVLWSNRELDASIVFLPDFGKELNSASPCHCNYVGQTVTLWGFSGGEPNLKFLRGTAGVDTFQSVVPPFTRKGMSGGPVYASSGCLVGVFSGYDETNIGSNVFAPAKYYYAAIAEIESRPPAAAGPQPTEPQPTPATDISILRGELHSLSMDIKAQIAAIPCGPKGERGEQGPPGERGPAGKDGHSFTSLELQAAVDAWLRSNPVEVDIANLSDEQVTQLAERINEKLPPFYPMWVDADGQPIDAIPGGVRLGYSMPLRITVIQEAVDRAIAESK